MTDMIVENPSLLEEWTSRWSDLVEFEIFSGRHIGRGSLRGVRERRSGAGAQRAGDVAYCRGFA